MSSYAAILNLLHGYAACIDCGDLEGAAGLFGHAKIKRGPEALLNQQEILAFWREVIVIYADGTTRTKHLITNPIIEIDETANRATRRSNYAVIQGLEDVPLQIVGAWPFPRRVRARGWRPGGSVSATTPSWISGAT